MNKASDAHGPGIKGQDDDDDDVVVVVVVVVVVLNIVWTLNIYRMTPAKVVHGTAVQGCCKIRSFVKLL